MNDISLEKMSTVELDALAMLIREEKDKRESKRFDELVVEACRVLNAIKDEYPRAEMCVELHCSECKMTNNINLFDLVDRFCASKFDRH